MGSHLLPWKSVWFGMKTVGQLPYEQKVKFKTTKKREIEGEDSGRIVVRSKREKKTDSLMKDLSMIRDEKLKKEKTKKAKRMEKFIAQKQEEETRKRNKMKITRKQDFIQEARRSGKRQKPAMDDQ